MKKTFIIFLSIVFILFVFMVINPPEIVFEETKIASPEKPSSVPNNAFWAGGIDGGNFIYLAKHTDNDTLFFAQIYNDDTGDIEYEGILKYLGNEAIHKSLNNPALYQGWDGENLYLASGELMIIYQKKNLRKKSI